jgi:hypothetical protein
MHDGAKERIQLCEGQFWRTERGLVQIVELGKKLVYYRLTRDKQGIGLTRMVRRDAFLEQLEATAAILVG